MISKKNQEIREKVLEGLKESNQDLLVRTKKNNGYLVFSYNNEIIKIEGDEIPDTLKEFEAKYIAKTSVDLKKTHKTKKSIRPKTSVKKIP